LQGLNLVNGGGQALECTQLLQIASWQGQYELVHCAPDTDSMILSSKIVA
jgi:hypothetical protein